MKHCSCGRPLSAGWTARPHGQTRCCICEVARALADWHYDAPGREYKRAYRQQPYYKTYQRAYRQWRAGMERAAQERKP